jgi:hypothetical protein
MSLRGYDTHSQFCENFHVPPVLGSATWMQSHEVDDPGQEAADAGVHLFENQLPQYGEKIADSMNEYLIAGLFIPKLLTWRLTTLMCLLTYMPVIHVRLHMRVCVHIFIQERKRRLPRRVCRMPLLTRSWPSSLEV